MNWLMIFAQEPAAGFPWWAGVLGFLGLGGLGGQVALFLALQRGTATKFAASDSKIDAVRGELGGKIDAVRGELGGKIDAVRGELGGKIDSNGTELASLKNTVVGIEKDVEHLTSTVAEAGSEITKLRDGVNSTAAAATRVSDVFEDRDRREQNMLAVVSAIVPPEEWLPGRWPHVVDVAIIHNAVVVVQQAERHEQGETSAE